MEVVDFLEPFSILLGKVALGLKGSDNGGPVL